MKRPLLAAAILLASSTFASAQTSTTSPLPQPRPNVDTNAPLPGANSFTEAQAKSRMEEAGFTNVTGLTKADNGIWRGQAMRNGAQVGVALDYRGNVVQQ